MSQFNGSNSLELYITGKQYYNNGEYTEALKYFEKAVRLKPDFYRGLASMGNVLYKLKRFNDSLIAFNRAIAIVKDLSYGLDEEKAKILSKLYNSKGLVLMRLERYDESLESSEKSLNLDSGNFGTLINKANLFIMKH